MAYRISRTRHGNPGVSSESLCGRERRQRAPHSQWRRRVEADDARANAFDKKGVLYDTVNIDKTEGAREFVVDELGAISAPVVVVRDAESGEIVDYWSDFRISKIQDLAKNREAVAASA